MTVRPFARITAMATLGALGATALLVGCSSSSDDPESVRAPSTTAVQESTTTTQANRPPEFRELAVARAELGQTWSDAIVATDPDGDAVVVRMGEAPLGFSPVLSARGVITGFEWQPREPGQWTVDLEATDPSGATTNATLELVARASRETSLVLSLGDSIAAGFGRDRSDFLGTDDCFRSEADTYAVFATELLVEAGALDDDTEVQLAGCRDATVESLDNITVQATDAGGDARGEPATQLQMARALNPTIITLTIGGATGGLFDVESLFVPSTADNSEPHIDEDALAAAQQIIDEGLRDVLAELLRTTDAHVAVTTYYDPTAQDPVGVEGCRASCFTESMRRVVDALNASIVGAADAVSEDRISIVRLDGEVDVWEAAGGFGPGFLRDRFGSSATCADRGDPERALVSTLDCIHPNTEGHQEIGELVAATLLSI